MPDYSLVPVDYQPEFDDHSLVPVGYDPFAADGVAQQPQIQLAQAQPQAPLQQPPAPGAGQPDAGAPAAGGVLDALKDENGRVDSYVYKKISTGTPPAGPQVTTANSNRTITATGGANRTNFGGVYGHTLTYEPAPTGFAEEMIFMAIRLFKVAGLAALVAFPAHGQHLSILDPAVVAITTYLQVITEDDVDQRTRLDLLLSQKQVGREDVIRELSIDLFGIARGEIAGLLSEDLVDKAFADMCSRRGVAPPDMMKTLEEKGIRLDTLRKRLRSEVARERLAQMQCRRDCEDRLDYPLVPKK